MTSLTSFSNIYIGTTNTNSGIDISLNNSLVTLDGLENVNHFKGIVTIYNNDKLSDLCALKNIFLNGNINDINIAFNLHNPSNNDIINGTNCSI